LFVLGKENCGQIPKGEAPRRRKRLLMSCRKTELYGKSTECAEGELGEKKGYQRKGDPRT